MTVDVTITREGDDSGSNLHVAVSERDIFGNSTCWIGNITALAPGESKTFCIHDMKDLRIYETKKEIPKPVYPALP